ncbi:hypothetical protein EU527_07265 [Candidatus Thorarchaeota archaeon]|nr:MAG: hypothetical protein EU527_07265 [Candidatus Thorarchaeota archaeon]
MILSHNWEDVYVCCVCATWGLTIKTEITTLKPKVLRNAVGTSIKVNVIAVDSQQLYAADNQGNLSIWKKTMLDSPIVIPSQTSTQIESLHSDDKYLYTGSIASDSVIRVHNQDLVLIKVLEGHVGTIFDLASDESVLATGSGDATVKLWRKNDWNLIGSIDAQTHFVLCVAIDRNFIYAGGIDNCVNVFNRDEYSRMMSLYGHHANVLSLATDEGFVYSGSGELWWGGPGSPRPSIFESAIRVWDKKDWTCVATLEGHTDNINAISVDSQYVYSASDDGTVRVFSKSDWSFQVSIDPGVGRIQDLVHDDRHVYFACADGNIRYVSKGNIANHSNPTGSI